MTTGILCATPEELDALHHRFEFDGEPTTLAGFQFWKGYVPDRSRPIVLSQSGIGKVNAATLATILFTTFGCDDLIFSGVAGALTDLEVGSVVLVTRGATYDYGLISNGVFTCVPVGDLPLPGIAQPLRDLLPVPTQVEQTLEKLRDRMADKLTIRLGSVLSGDVFINCQERTGDQSARRSALGACEVDRWREQAHPDRRGYPRATTGRGVDGGWRSAVVPGEGLRCDNPRGCCWPFGAAILELGLPMSRCGAPEY